ncbi:MAG: hypothetical protein RR623_09555, partial [Bacilli bacterium]
MKFIHTIAFEDGRNISVGDVLNIKTDSRSFKGRVISINFTATHEPVGLNLDCSKEFESNVVNVYLKCIESFSHISVKKFEEEN